MSEELRRVNRILHLIASGRDVRETQRVRPWIGGPSAADVNRASASSQRLLCHVSRRGSAMSAL